MKKLTFNEFEKNNTFILAVTKEQKQKRYEWLKENNYRYLNALTINQDFICHYGSNDLEAFARGSRSFDKVYTVEQLEWKPELKYNEYLTRDLIITDMEKRGWLRNRYYYIDIEFKVGVFSDGLARILKEDTFAFIDKTGKIIIKERFDFACDFSEGLAAVKKIDKWGYIDATGGFAIEPAFDNVGDFSEGRAAARKNFKHGFIDREGKWVIEPGFDWAWDFSEGLAAVMIKY